MTDDPSDQDIRVEIMRLARMIRITRARNDITDAQFAVLRQLDKVGVLSPSALAAFERVSRPAMNRTLNTLETGGLISRSASEKDVRHIEVSITERGREVIVKTLALRTAWFSERMAELTAADQRVIRRAAQVMRKMSSP